MMESSNRNSMKQRILVFVAALCLFGHSTAHALPTANSIITAQSLGTAHLQNFIQGTDVALTYKTIYTAGANGSKCNGISVANTDSTITHLVSFEIINGANTYLTSSFTTISSGVGAVTTANALTTAIWAGLPPDSDGNPYIQMVSGDVLKATFATALTASLTPLAQITVDATCSDF